MEEREYFTLRSLEDRYWWLQGLRQLAWDMLRRHGLQSEKPRLLDIGCGTGGMIAFLYERLGNARMYGLDRHPLAIELSRNRNAGYLCHGDAQRLPFGDGVFDAALMLDVLYTRGMDVTCALREAYRVLAKGGVLIVNLPAFEILRGSHDAAVHSGHRYTAGEVRALLTGGGFEVLRITYWNMFLAPAVLVRRKWSRLGRAGRKPISDLAPLAGGLNVLLGAVLRMERSLISRADLPFGSSVLAIAQK